MISSFPPSSLDHHHHHQLIGSTSGNDDENTRPPPSTTTLPMYPTPMQLKGSSLGLEFDTLNFNLLLSEELKARLAVTPFTRMVVIFR